MIIGLVVEAIEEQTTSPFQGDIVLEDYIDCDIISRIVDSENEASVTFFVEGYRVEVNSDSQVEVTSMALA